MKYFSLGVITLCLSACQNLATSEVQVHKHYQWQTELPKEDLIISAVGYAPVEEQPASTPALKTIKAIKASKLDAYRDLSEKVHGLRISSEQKIGEFVLQDEQLRSSLQGVIKGAKIVKTYQLNGVYVTEMELNLRDVYRIQAFTQPNNRLLQAEYY